MVVIYEIISIKVGCGPILVRSFRLSFLTSQSFVYASSLYVEKKSTDRAELLMITATMIPKSGLFHFLVAAVILLTGCVSALGDSSCLPIPHYEEEVIWKTTRCAFCFPNFSKANQTLWVNYNGTLTNGTLFDSSYTAEKPWPVGDPFNFTLGAGQVIKG
jgi:hypothetical protein